MMAFSRPAAWKIVLIFASLVLWVGCGPAAGQSVPTASSSSQESYPSDSEASADDPPVGQNAEAPTANQPQATITQASSTAVVTLGDPSLTSGIPGEGDLTLEHIDAWLSDEANHAHLEVLLPSSLVGARDMVKGLDQNPMTRAKIELGRQLYFDTRLSADNTISCASCHAPENGYCKDTSVGIGVGDQTGNRNSPVAFNRIITDAQFWDGRAASLEEQAKGPIENPIEMGNTHTDAVAKVQGLEGYQRQFAAIFPGEGISIDTIAQAIATFERAIVTGPAPYDYLEIMKAVESQYDAEEIAEELADEDPELFAIYQHAKAVCNEKLSASARRGRELFFSDKANCTACHTGANFTDELYHNIGVGMDSDQPDLGRYEITQQESDRGAFKTPTVRNAVMTAPYMHDGSQKTLEEVVEWYAKGGHPNDHLSDKIKKLDLTDQDKADLLAFMKEGLTSDLPPVVEGRLPM